MSMRASFPVLLLGLFFGSGYAQACCAPGSPCLLVQAEQMDKRYPSSAHVTQSSLAKVCSGLPAASSAAMWKTLVWASLPSDLYTPSRYLSIYLSQPDPPPKAVRA
ncbi:hypothetical protein ACFQDN_05675 [Pseudomonas asuensis]|uniref:hypothetical protein n=1 Tax=Pseudomonas asuensis TaxID=1825787 RepID=UPI00166D3FDF|nr:hypothetical protein [Pseudomonas asuensis]